MRVCVRCTLLQCHHWGLVHSAIIEYLTGRVDYMQIYVVPKMHRLEQMGLSQGNSVLCLHESWWTLYYDTLLCNLAKKFFLGWWIYWPAAVISNCVGAVVCMGVCAYMHATVCVCYNQVLYECVCSLHTTAMPSLGIGSLSHNWVPDRTCGLYANYVAPKMHRLEQMGLSQGNSVLCLHESWWTLYNDTLLCNLTKKFFLGWWIYWPAAVISNCVGAVVCMGVCAYMCIHGRFCYNQVLYEGVCSLHTTAMPSLGIGSLSHHWVPDRTCGLYANLRCT